MEIESERKIVWVSFKKSGVFSQFTWIQLKMSWILDILSDSIKKIQDSNNLSDCIKELIGL